MNNKNMVHIHYEVLFSCKKRWNSQVNGCKKKDEIYY